MCRVLIIEDDHTLNDSMATFLRNTGLEVIQAYSYEEYQNLIKVNPPQILLIDLTLNGQLTGIDIVKETKDIPSIVISGNTDEQKIISSYKNGCRYFHPKPIRIHLLRTQIDLIRNENGFEGESVNDLFIIDLEVGELEYNGNLLKLRYQENRLLSILIENNGTYVSYEYLLHKIWPESPETNKSNLNTLISRLTNRIDKLGNTRKLMHRKYGLGLYLDTSAYKFPN